MGSFSYTHLDVYKGQQLSCTPALSGVQGLDYAYLLGESTLWRMQREECRRVLPVLDTVGGRSLYFTSAEDVYKRQG